MATAIPDSAARAGSDAVPCDLCSDQAAVLYCRADSARLCLLCDHQVHSANPLSRKHLRSQICDNCGSEPASICCRTDKLLLCQDCDWDTHGVSSATSSSHDRSPVDGFFGVPSVAELASLWEFELECAKRPGGGQIEAQLLEDMVLPFCFQDLVVPSASTSFNKRSFQKKQNAICGKHRQLIERQLMELSRRGVVEGGSGESLLSDTHCTDTWRENVEDMNGPDAALPLPPPTAAVAPPTQRESSDSIGAERNMIPDSNANRNTHTPQIWDFNLGRSRGHNVPDHFGCGKKDEGFMIITYDELMQERPSTKDLNDIYQLNPHVAPEDIAFFNNNSNSIAFSQGTATSESNNLLSRRASLNSALGKAKGYLGLKDYHPAEQTSTLKNASERTVPKTKSDMEVLTKYRGDAMLRYQEKKKNRRHGS
ncbi:hypothetical protein SAY86_001944 [Trapa natans]|uniref:B box-type domain-containing protein n=1 Tax=Trapa natans TaxID=22666 RepID=A0AAN7R211_TRANT|nr:hypothetical protein SAY86_001944 [Trapa natans]